MNMEQKLRSIDAQAVALALPAETALVEFVRFDVLDFKAVPGRDEPQWKPAHYLAFVLFAREPDHVQMIDLGEAESIDRMIVLFRASITGEAKARHMIPLPKTPGHVVSDGTALRAAVFDPLRSALGERTRLFLAPDGDLTRLPFEVLPTADGRRLIDDYHISYLSVGRDVLLFGVASTNQPSAPLVAADPDFDLRSDGAPTSAEITEPLGRRSRDLDRGKRPFERLPGTREEGKQVADKLGVQPLLQAAVLEHRLKACQSPLILHIATHGLFMADQERDSSEHQVAVAKLLMGSWMSGLLVSENPLLHSGLALAGANCESKGFIPPHEAEDGILTAEDVSGLDLLATELVVLSACGTGLGEVHTGEGVFGLRRAFILAGAKTLVMSLWKVPDKQTQELMVDFYRRILVGRPRADALREAQLAMKAEYPDPYYWGAFICQGNPGPLPQQSSRDKSTQRSDA
jgi:CHAT domain-containing protein